MTTTQSRRYDTVSFLTDYGNRDEFVGVVKSVIRDIAPHVGVVDLTHEIAPFDVRAGSLALARCIGYVPSGVVLAVVDPGVGTNRRAVAIEVAGGAGVVIGPDNGLLAPAVAMAGGAERAVELTNPEYQLESAGADVRGPRHLRPGRGPPLQRRRVDGPRRRGRPGVLMPGTVPLPRADGDAVVAEVLWVDRFGNCQLNLGPDDLEEFVGFEDVERVSLRLGDPTAPTGVVGAHGGADRRASPASAAASGWCSTRTACWRSASIDARRPTSSASVPATRCGHAAHRSIGRHRHPGHAGADSLTRQ